MVVNRGAQVLLSSLPLWFRFGYEARLGGESAAPWLLLGIMLASVLSAVKPDAATLGRWFGGPAAGPAAAAGRGAILGLAVPLCSCGALPLAVALGEEAVPVAGIVAFVTAAQSAGIDSMLFTVGQFGGPAAAARLAAAAVLAAAVGLGVGKVRATPSAPAVKGSCCGDSSCCGTTPPATAKQVPDCCSGDTGTTDTATCCDAPTAAALSGFGSAVFEVLARVPGALCDLFAEVWLAVGAGVLFSAAMNIAMPVGGLWSTGLEDSISTRAVLFAAMVPIQMCEHGVVTVAAALATHGISVGQRYQLQFVASCF